MLIELIVFAKQMQFGQLAIREALIVFAKQMQFGQLALLAI